MKAYRETINRGGSRSVGPRREALPPSSIAGDGDAGSAAPAASSDPAITESTKRRGKAAGGEG